jgi:hypothetical protein
MPQKPTNEPTYTGIHKDSYGGMTPTGQIVKDAWLFDIIPMSETCEGWSRRQVQDLYEKVFAAWEPYGHLVSQLPPDLKAKHKKIHDEAIERARQMGWDPELGDED